MAKSKDLEKSELSENHYGLNVLTSSHFESEMRTLQDELVKLERWVTAKRLKVCILFEGRDAAGKGGIIKTVTDRVSTRTLRLHGYTNFDQR